MRLPFLSFVSIPARRSPAEFFAIPRDGTTPPANGNGGANTEPLSKERIRSLIKREGGGDSYKAIQSLVRENASYRIKARDAEEKLKVYERDGVAPKGAVLIAGDDAKIAADVVKYLADNKMSWKDLFENAKAAPDLRAKTAKAERKTLVDDCAKDMEWDSDALLEVVDTKGVELALRDVSSRDESGKRIVEQIWSVRKAGDDKAEWEPVSEYADEHWKLFIPALESGIGHEDDADANEREAPENGNGRRTREQSRQGARREDSQSTRFVEQSRSKEPPAGGAKDEKQLRQAALDTGIYNTL